MNRQGLKPGTLKQMVSDSFSDVGKNTPAELLITVAGWDGLLSPLELHALRMVVEEMDPIADCLS